MRQVSDIGGWIAKYGNMTCLDRTLDADPCLNHAFVEQGEALLRQKIANPAMRTGKLMKDQVNIVEEKRQGLKKPKRKFLTLEAYTKKHGKPDAARIKTMKVDGVEIKGVDVIDEDDQGVYGYVDEVLSTVQRTTVVSDPDVVISSDQSGVIFNAASKQLASAPKEESCVVLGTSSSSRDPNCSKDMSESGEGASVAEGDSDADDHDFNPFAELFGRLKPSTSAPVKPQSKQLQATAKRHPKPKAQSKSASTKAGAKSSGKPGKRVSEPEKPGNHAERDAEEPASKKHGPDKQLAGDDLEVAKRFEELMETCRLLDCESHDEAEFSKWGKAKMQSLADVRNQVYTKKKSLKRRKEGMTHWATHSSAS